MVNILIVEDNKNTQKLLQYLVKKEGYNAFLADDGLIALDVLEKNHIDLILLDIMMPNLDGLEFTKILRESNFDIPIIIITSKSEIEDKHQGFTIGADDYIVKPIDNHELILRINALLRRSQINYKKIIVINNLKLDFNTLTVTKLDKTITLPKKEFELLFKLLSFPGKIFTKLELFEEIWGLDSESIMDHTIAVHINRLRNKFSSYDDFEIITVRNLGYKAVLKDE